MYGFCTAYLNKEDTESVWETKTSLSLPSTRCRRTWNRKYQLSQLTPASAPAWSWSLWKLTESFECCEWADSPGRSRSVFWGGERAGHNGWEIGCNFSTPWSVFPPFPRQWNHSFARDGPSVNGSSSSARRGRVRGFVKVYKAVNESTLTVHFVSSGRRRDGVEWRARPPTWFRRVSALLCLRHYPTP